MTNSPLNKKTNIYIFVDANHRLTAQTLANTYASLPSRPLQTHIITYTHTHSDTNELRATYAHTHVHTRHTRAQSRTQNEYT